MRRALAVRRVSRAVYTRALCNLAREPLQWAALEALDVRLSLRARGDNHHAHFVVVARSICCLCERASPASSGSRIFTFIAPNSAGFGLCCSSPLRLVSARLRLCSARLLVSASLFSALLCFAQFCFVYASASFLSVPRLYRSLDAHDSNRYVGAFVTCRILYASHACGEPCKRRCARERFTQLCAWAAPVSGVRDARCASLLVCSWLQSPRAPHALALPI